MSEFFGKKYKVTSKTSRLLQEAVCKAGGEWGFGYGKQVLYTKSPYLYVDSDGGLMHGTGLETFKLDPLPEGFLEVVTIVKLVEPKETVKLGGKTYYKEDLEKALENIKPLEGA